MEVAIIGGGVAGLSLAMNLHARGIRACVFERAPEIRELGVGITLLPHAMREFAALGVKDELVGAGVVIRESCFFNRFGQLIYREDRGQHAGYAYPEVSIHRGRLHMILYRAALARLGADAIRTDHECVRVEQDETGATAYFRASSTGRALEPVRADVVVACDGVNSAMRRQFYPDDEVAFAGINTWRGITRRKPFLTGKSYTRTGSILTGKIVIYPIIDDVDGDGNQLINWMAEIQRDTFAKNDWNQPGNLADFYPIYQNWRFDWLDVAELDPHRRSDPRIPDGGQGPGGPLDLRPGDARRRRRTSDVSARLQRRRPGRHRCPHAGGMPGHHRRGAWRCA